jgi:hypothetical protein
MDAVTGELMLIDWVSHGSTALGGASAVPTTVRGVACVPFPRQQHRYRREDHHSGAVNLSVRLRKRRCLSLLQAP